MTKLNKKAALVSFIVCAVLLVLCCVGGNVSASAAQIGAEKAASSKFAGGSGTVSDPYLISNETQLLAINNNLTAHYRLTNDIALSNYEWIPIGGYYNGSESDVFNGTLDGSGYSISNLQRYADITVKNDRIYFGMFSRIGSSGVVKNLTMSNCKISMAGPNVNNSKLRVFVGAIAGSVRGIISSVSVDGTVNYDIQANGMSYVGSVAGAAYAARVTNCTNYATITSGRYSGGAGGIAGHSAYTTFTGCTNYGKIIAKCTTWGGSAAAGGIVGELYKNNVQNWWDYFVSCYSSESLLSTSHFGGGLSPHEYKGQHYATPSPYEYY